MLPMTVSSLGSTFFLSLTLITLVVFMIIKNSFKKTCHEKEVKKKPPSPSICLPIIGHMHVMAKYHENHWDGFSAIARSLGNVYFVKMGIRKIVVVNSLESIREVLLSKGEIFVNRPDFQRYHAIFNGDRENALALCDWSRTQRIRRIVAQMVILPRFGSGMLDSLNKCIRVDINDFLGIKMKQLESTTSLSSPSSTLITKSEILFLFGNIFSNYLCSKRFPFGHEGLSTAIYGYDYIFWDINQSYAWDFIPWLTSVFGVGSRYLRDLSQVCNSVKAYMQKEVINPRLHRYMKEHGINEHGQKIRETDREDGKNQEDHGSNKTRLEQHDSHEALDEEALIKKNARRSTSKEMEGKDFLDVSLEHHFQFKDQYPWDVAVYEVLDLIGGSSAVGNLAMRTLGFLALHPEYQDIIAQEAKYAKQMMIKGNQHPASDQDIIDLNHRPHMRFTEACLMETLRLASSPIIPHVANRDSTIQGFHVEKGTMVLFNTYILNMSDKYWENPKEFNPKRFLVRKQHTVDENEEVEVGEGDSRLKNSKNTTSVNNNDSSEGDEDYKDAQDLTNQTTSFKKTDYKTMKPGDWKLLKPEHFMPFSCGRRACLGYKMVMTTSFVAIANLCQYFVLTPENENAVKAMKHQLRINGNVALPMDSNGCFKIKIVKRE